MKTRWPLVIALVCSVAALLSADSAVAQSRYTGTSTNGLFGQNTVGGNASTQAPSSGNSGSTGSSGSSGASGGTADQNIALTARNMAPAVTTQQQRGAFVGADSSDTTNARSLQATNARNQSANNGLAQLQNLFSQGMQNINQGNRAGAQVQIPVALKLGFTPQPVSPARFQAFQTRLTKLPSIRFMGPASVTLEGRTAVLRGTVATPEDRELAEALAMMEPDVRIVRNELTVDSSATTAEDLPTAPATNSP
jgi:hypothetical protein